MLMNINAMSSFHVLLLSGVICEILRNRFPLERFSKELFTVGRLFSTLSPSEWRPRCNCRHPCESGRGVALVQQGFDRLSGPRLKVRPLTPTHPPHVVGVAYRNDVNSPATKNFVAAAKRASSA